MQSSTGPASKEPLRSSVEAILECEALALTGLVPACVVRLGYLYGPESRDLRAYRTAFCLGRPYWSGPAKALQYHLHQFDAVSDLLAAARPRNAGKIFYATDRRAVSFMQLMDAFAHRVGRRTPLHLPLLSKPLGQGDHSRETHAANGAGHATSGAVTARAGMETEVSGLPKGPRSGHQSLGQLSRRTGVDRSVKPRVVTCPTGMRRAEAGW